MPSYVYTGPGERVYPETRDVNGVHLGTVTPGDIRMFDEPPADGLWAPEIPPRDEGEQAGSEIPDPGAEGGAGEPDGPQPAPPAVIPGA